MIIKTIRLFDLRFFILLTALIVVIMADLTKAAQEVASPAAASLTDFKISFKMNPSITRGIYVGDRWISPPYYSVEEGKEITVEAVVQSVDAKGKLIAISAAWEAGDPAMITISTDKGPKVNLTILKEGQSELRVTFGGISKRLPVKSWYKDNAIHVEISEPK